jgi:branched-chain amino acid aminotransferase
MKKRKVFFNGKFIDENDAKISIYDSSLMFGDMVFEMTRSFNKKHFMLEEHIERLFYGIKILEIPFKYSKKNILDFCVETAKKNNKTFNKDDEHRLMIDVTRGVLDIYKPAIKGHKGSNLIIADFPLRWTVSGMGKLFKKGINAVITSQRAIPSRYMDPKIKNRSRLFYLMANIEVSNFKGDDNWALLLDESGNIAEGSGDNFFIVKDGEIITPQGKDILRGISRKYVMENLAVSLDCVVKEKNIDPYDVYTADEAFMTGTPFCMLPVTHLNFKKIGNGKVGPIFKKLINKWSNNIGLDIVKQINAWDKNLKTKMVKLSPYKFKK